MLTATGLVFDTLGACYISSYVRTTVPGLASVFFLSTLWYSVIPVANFVSGCIGYVTAWVRVVGRGN